jgi:hypothetical protein
MDSPSPESALARIDAALARLEAAATRPRAAVSQSLSQLDGLIAGQQP